MKIQLFIQTIRTQCSCKYTRVLKPNQVLIISGIIRIILIKGYFYYPSFKDGIKIQNNGGNANLLAKVLLIKEVVLETVFLIFQKNYVQIILKI